MVMCLLFEEMGQDSEDGSVLEVLAYGLEFESPEPESQVGVW